MISVESQQWLTFWTESRASGHTFFDFLTAVDRLESIEVIGHAVDPRTHARVLASCQVPVGTPRLSSLSGLFLGAAWHERETAEMFGMTFTGLEDSRRLLLRSPLGRPPLRKGTVLAARVAVEWPGTAEPGGSPSRRRLRPPGVPELWLEDR